MAVLTESQRATVQWVIDYMERGGAGNAHIDQKVSDELARVFRNMCGFRCGCPGSFQEGLDETPYTTLLQVVLCLGEQTGMSAADQAIIQWVIDYMERGSSGGAHLDQKASDELARVFRDGCGFVCGCPGTFQTGLLNSPFTTLLRAILCADAGAVGIGEAGGESAQLLLAACGFGILAGTTITNTGATIIDGDLGLSPGSSVTGFPPGIVLGEQHVTDVEAANAQLALTAAYLDLEGRGGSTSVAGDLGGQTLTPGVYKSTSSLAVTTANLTLDAQGNADAVFIFQIASTLLVSAGMQIILAGGAQAKNVLWQVGASATLETTSVFKGSILALTSISVQTGASVEGRLLARNGAVTLDTNSVVVPACE
jgi:hypothetical protein